MEEEDKKYEEKNRMAMILCKRKAFLWHGILSEALYVNTQKCLQAHRFLFSSLSFSATVLSSAKYERQTKQPQNIYLCEAKIYT